LASLSIWATIRSGAVAAETEGVIREEQLGSYHAERVSTAILDCRRYEQGLLLSGPDFDAREIHLAGFLWFCDVLQERYQSYLRTGRRTTCLTSQESAMLDYRDAVLRVAGRLHLENDLESVRKADLYLEPFKEMMRVASKCASVAAKAHADTVEDQVVQLTGALRRDQVFASVGGAISFLLLAFGITTLIVPTARRARRLADIARRLSDGERGVDCRVGGDDELSQAGDALERMRCLVAEREEWLLRRESEARKLTEAIERTALPTFITDARGILVWNNRAAEGLLRGVHVASIVGSGLERVLRTTGYDEATVSAVVGALAKGETFSGERIGEAADGARSWFRLEGYPVLSESGSATNFVILERDVSDARHVELAREAYANMVAMLLGDAPLKDVLNAFSQHVELSIPGVLISVLVLEGDRLGVASAPSLPQAFSRLVEGLQIGPDAGSCGRCAYTGEPVIAEDTSTHPAWARYRGVAEAFELGACWSLPVRSHTGELLGTLAAYSRSPRRPTPAELSTLRIGAGFAGLALGRRRAEARSEQTSLELSEARAEVDRLRRDGIATTEAGARDLGASLRNVREALAAGKAESGPVEDVLRLLDDAIAPDEANVPDRRSWVSPLAILRASIANTNGQTAVHGRIAAQPDLPELVLIDADRTRRVVSHVLSLVLQRGGGVRRSADLALVCPPARQTGEPAHLLRIEIRVAGVGGVGDAGDVGADALVDFALARRVLRRMGGNIGMRLDGGDAVVLIELPCDALGTFTGASPRTGGVDAHPSDGAALQGRILLVDDHADIRGLFAHYLRRAGAEVEECESGIAALQRMMPRPDGVGLDLVLLDMQLPGHDGYAVTRIARAAGCRLPIVAITAHAIGDERSRCLAAGCDDFATKPLTRAELLDVAGRHLRRAASESRDPTPATT
jgi:CheY-like chemotaxis protein